jgi:hypothetical protein
MEQSAVSADAGARGSARVACSQIFLSPTRAFEEVRRGAPWVWPFLVCAVLSLIAFALLAPAQQVGFQEQMAQMQQRNPNLSAENLQKMRGVFQAIGILTAPVVVLGSLAVSAALFFAIFQISGWNLDYKRVFRALAYAGLVNSGLGTLVYGIAAFANYKAGHVETAGDVFPRLGLDLIGGEGIVRGLLAAVNPFSVWWLVVLVYGFAALSGRSRTAVMAPVLTGGVLWLLVGGLLQGWQFSRSAG